MRKRIFVLMFSIGLVFFLAQSAQAATADHVVISQIQTDSVDGSGGTEDDWIELYNPTDAVVDLNGWSIQKSSATGGAFYRKELSGTIPLIPAHGYFLIVRDNANTSASLKLAKDFLAPGSSSSFTLSDNYVIYLVSNNEDISSGDDSDIVDKLGMGTAGNFEGSPASNPKQGESIERRPGVGQGNGEDTNNNAADFFTQTAPHPRNTQSAIESALSSTPPPSPSPQGGGNTGAVEGNPPASPANNPPAFNLQITEIMPNPKGADSGAEWVEFFNPGTAGFDLSGWILDDDSLDVIPGSGFYTIVAPASVPAGGYLAITIPKGSFALNNSGQEAVRLFDASKAMRLRQAFAGPAKEGESYAMGSGQEWQWVASSTPGAANSFAVSAAVDSPTIKISETLPNPAGDELEGEFIELFNYGDDSIELSGWAVADARKRYEITAEDFEETELAAKSYFVLYRETTAISLNNSGEEEVRLYDPSGNLRDKIVFDATGHSEQAYAWKEGSAWQWTTAFTPLKENIIAAASKEAAKPKEIAKIAEVKKSADTSKAAELPEPVALSSVRELPLGAKVQTSGVLVVEPGLLGEHVTYLQGSGIRVLLPAAAGSMLLLPGMKVAFAAELAESHGEMELKVPTDAKIETLAQDEPVLPHEIETGAIGEDNEGFLVSISGSITQQSGGTFYIDDGSGAARILVADSTGIQKPKSKKGDFVSVIGVVTQWNDVYRVMPRYADDLVFGQVAGAKSLPRTGIDFWLMFAVLGGGAIMIWIILNRKGIINEQS